MKEPIPVVVKSADQASEAPPGSIPIDLYFGENPPTPPEARYGSFYDTLTQPLTANTNHVVLLRSTYESYGVSVVSGSRVTFADAGIYDIQFSLQVASSTNQTRNLHIWGRRNGVDLGYSSGRMSITEQNSVIVPTWNYHLTVSPGDYFELLCRTDGTTIALAAEAATANYPATASAILTVQQVNL